MLWTGIYPCQSEENSLVMYIVYYQAILLWILYMHMLFCSYVRHAAKFID